MAGCLPSLHVYDLSHALVEPRILDGVGDVLIHHLVRHPARTRPNRHRFPLGPLRLHGWNPRRHRRGRLNARHARHTRTFRAHSPPQPRAERKDEWSADDGHNIAKRTPADCGRRSPPTPPPMRAPVGCNLGIGRWPAVIPVEHWEHGGVGTGVFDRSACPWDAGSRFGPG
jgi:hypothetical protein